MLADDQPGNARRVLTALAVAVRVREVVALAGQRRAQDRTGQRVRALVRRSTPAGAILANSCGCVFSYFLFYEVSIERRTFQLHPLLKALLESTGGTLFPGGDRDRAGRPPKAHVVLPVLDRPLEEAFARLAREDAVVKAGDLVTADGAGTKIERLIL